MSSDADTQFPRNSPPRAAAGEVGRPGEVVRLLPITVMVVSADRYFRAAATMLLTRRGCSVLSAVDAGEALDQAAKGIDVLVAEPAGPAGEVRTALALAAGIDAAGLAAGRRVAPVGVVVVGEPEELVDPLAAEAGAAQPVLDKWGPFERLYQAICDRDRARRLAPPAGAPAWLGAARGPGAV